MHGTGNSRVIRTVMCPLLFAFAWAFWSLHGMNYTLTCQSTTQEFLPSLSLARPLSLSQRYEHPRHEALIVWSDQDAVLKHVAQQHSKKETKSTPASFSYNVTRPPPWLRDGPSTHTLAASKSVRLLLPSQDLVSAQTNFDSYTFSLT